MIKQLVIVIPSLGIGGMERVMSELVNHFSLKSDLKVHLVLYGINRDILYDLPENIVIHIPLFKFNNNFRIWNTLKTLCFLRSQIQSLKPDKILSFGEYWNSFVLLALYGMKYPVFISDRCQPNKRFGLLHDRLRKWLYPCAKGIITQTSQAEVIYRLLFKKSIIKTIGNPIHFVNTNEVIEKENIVLTVGRLIDTKHHDELIKLFTRINKPGWKLVIVGGDALKQKGFIRLQELINELDVSDRIILAGICKNVEKYYLQSKIFAFTSSSEGFPNVIGEAMSAGLPVVAFDCIAGPSDMITDGVDGFLVPLFNYDLFSDKLLMLIEREDIRIEYGTKAQSSIMKYNMRYIGDEYYKFIFS